MAACVYPVFIEVTQAHKCALSKSELRESLSKFGAFSGLKFKSIRAKTFAFVNYAEETAAKAAAKGLRIRGISLLCQLLDPIPERELQVQVSRRTRRRFKKKHSTVASTIAGDSSERPDAKLSCKSNTRAKPPGDILSKLPQLRLNRQAKFALGDSRADDTDDTGAPSSLAGQLGSLKDENPEAAYDHHAEEAHARELNAHGLNNCGSTTESEHCLDERCKLLKEIKAFDRLVYRAKPFPSSSSFSVIAERVVISEEQPLKILMPGGACGVATAVRVAEIAGACVRIDVLPTFEHPDKMYVVTKYDIQHFFSTTTFEKLVHGLTESPSHAFHLSSNELVDRLRCRSSEICGVTRFLRTTKLETLSDYHVILGPTRRLNSNVRKAMFSVAPLHNLDDSRSSGRIFEQSTMPSDLIQWPMSNALSLKQCMRILSFVGVAETDFQITPEERDSIRQESDNCTFECQRTSLVDKLGAKFMDMKIDHNNSEAERRG